MSFNLDRTRRNRLYWLLDVLLAGELTTERFAQEFHRMYVVDMEEAELSAIERETFADLFKVTNWYATPHQRSLDGYPARKTDADVLRAVEQAKARLRPRLP